MKTLDSIAYLNTGIAQTDPLYFGSAAVLAQYSGTLYLLVDSGSACRSFFKGVESQVFAAQAVNLELQGNMTCVSFNPPLATISYNEFVSSSGVATVTGPSNIGTTAASIETVSLQTKTGRMSTGTDEQEFPLCFGCGNSTIVKLTTSQDTTGIYVCNTVVSKGADFSSAVYAVAFPEKFVLVTEDTCLGTALGRHDSYSIVKGLWGSHVKQIC